MGKYFRPEQATDDKMAHTHGMLDTQGYKYVILLFFSLQQWLHERASMLPCTYIVLFYISPQLPRKFLSLNFFWFTIQIN